MKKLLALILTFMVSPAFARTVYLDEKNTVIFTDVINSVTVDTIIAAVHGKRMRLPKKEVLYLVIWSGGGSYDASKTMMEKLDRIPNVQLICQACGSGAGLVFAASHHRRLALEMSDMMMHEMYMNHVTAVDVKNTSYMKMFLAASEEFNKILYTIIGMSKPEYEAMIVGKEWHVAGEDMVKLHLADEVVEIECSPDLVMIGVCD